MRYPQSLEKLIHILSKLPGVGRRTAERYAFDLLLHWSENEHQDFQESIFALKKTIGLCSSCGCLTEKEHCLFCRDTSRKSHVLCIVANPKDVFAIENTKEFNGMYHVLPGLLSPLDGRGEEVLEISKMHMRIQKENINELILALDSSLEGDATSLFLKQELEAPGIAISRLAFGIPVGSALEYVDGGTLARAFHGRASF